MDRAGLLWPLSSAIVYIGVQVRPASHAVLIRLPVPALPNQHQLIVEFPTGESNFPFREDNILLGMGAHAYNPALGRAG